MSASLKSGTRVHVEFDGEAITEPWIRNLLSTPDVMFDSGAGGFTGIVDGDGIVHLIWRRDFHSATPDVFTVTDPEPEFWPPQIGDIWSVDGAEYVVRANWAHHGVVVVETIERFTEDPNKRQATYYEGDGYISEHELARFRELNPVLIRRR